MGLCCSKSEEEQKSQFPQRIPPSLHATEMLEWPNTGNQMTALVKIPPMASWPTQINCAIDVSCRSSMRTEEEFMDGASVRKLSDASAMSSSSTRVDDYCDYNEDNRLSYQQSTDKESYPVEITVSDSMLDPARLPDFSWMQRPVNTYPVPTGRKQTEKENLIHYVMRYVMNG